MKKYYFALLVIIMPFLASAQISHAEDFVNGDELLYMVCTMPDSPGGTGISVIWDFSSVLDSGNGQHTTWVFDDTAVAGDLVLSPVPYLTNSGNRIQKTATQSFLAAVLGSQVSYTYDQGVLWIDRNLSYGLLDSNSFTSIVTAATTTLNGGGTSHLEVDGSGTLKTPAGTYNNVLRVKRIVDNIDSFTNNSLHNFQVTYLWYDNTHTAPLFRIDSLYRTGTGIFQNASATTGTASYLQAIYPAGLQTISQSGALAAAYLDDNGISVNADLEQGGLYKLSLFDLTGKKLYTTSFVANGHSWHFSPAVQLPTASYMMAIEGIKSAAAPIVLKVVKQ